MVQFLETPGKIAARYKEKKRNPGGEPIYTYSEGQVARRNADKAKRLKKLNSQLHKLQTKVKQDLTSQDQGTRLVALAVALIDQTAERVGGAAALKADNEDGRQHFGVTTWRKRHIQFGKARATITYVGKSGVKQVKTVDDPAVLRALKQAHGECKDDIFCHDDVTVTAEHVNQYLKQFGITAKDIRGLHANIGMKQALKRIRSRGGPLPEDKKERDEKLKQEFNEALEEVAESVGGHEPATLKNQYLVPEIERDYMRDGSVSLDIKAANLISRYKQARISQ